MARKASIFLNLNEYLIHVPEEQRYHLDEVEDINFQPYSFKNRLKKLSEDVEYQSSVSTDIRSLFIALNLRIKDLDTADLPDQFRRLRNILKSQAGIEIVPPGNPVSIQTDQSFRICRIYDLARDPDIVSAKQNRGATNLGRILENRIRTAAVKLNNFAIALHLFESLFITTAHGECINTEQRFVLQNFIENALFPADTQRYLQSCFSQIIEHPPVETYLDQANAYLKPITNEHVLDKYLNITANIAALSGENINFQASPYASQLKKYYNSFRFKIKNESTDPLLDSAFSTITRNRISDGREQSAGEAVLPQTCKNIFSSFTAKTSQKFSLKTDFVSAEKFLAGVRKHLSGIGYIQSSLMEFKDHNEQIRLANTPVSEPNVYMYIPNRITDNYMWEFAITGDLCFKTTYGSKNSILSYAEFNTGERRNFAAVLNKSDYGNITNNHLYIIGGNLEYRLLVEGLLSTIKSTERINAFIWLAEWYKIAERISLESSKKLDNAVRYLGDILSIYAFLFPQDLNKNHKNMLCMNNRFNLYARLKLAEAFQEHALSVENAAPYIFEAFILEEYCNYAYMKFNSTMSKALMIRHAYKIYLSVIKSSPDILKDIVRDLQFSEIPFSCRAECSTSEFYKNDLWRLYTTIYEMGQLDSYRRYVIEPLLPKQVVLGEKTRHLLKYLTSKIIESQEILRSYLAQPIKNIHNEIIYRAVEHDLSDEKTLPAYLENFRSRLIEAGRLPVGKAIEMFNLRNMNPDEALICIFTCAKTLNLGVYPNLDIEDAKFHTKNFQFLRFTGTVPDISGNCALVVQPYRIALSIGAHYKTKKDLYQYITGFINSRENMEKMAISEEDVAYLRNYFSEMTEISMTTPGRFYIDTKKCRTVSPYNEIQESLFTTMIYIIASHPDERELCYNCCFSLSKKYMSNVISSELLQSLRIPGKTSGMFASGISSDKVLHNIIPQNSSPKNLNTELISSKVEETRKAQELLAPIFAESVPGPAEPNIQVHIDENITADTGVNGVSADEHPEPTPELKGMDILELLAPEYQRLLKRLLQIGEFTMGDFRSICAENKLMPSGAMEVINSWALEQFDCTILEEDEPMFFDRDLLKELL